MSHDISILLLAAGSSTRYGSPKQLLPFRGKPLICHLAELALQSKASATYVVLGAQAEEISKELAKLRVHTIINKQWQEGIGSSLAVGVQGLPSNVDAVLIMLCDQPLVTADHLNTIIETYQLTHKPIVASSYAGTQGAPVLFSRRFFPELVKLTGDTGAKQIILRHKEEAVSIPFADGEEDINTPADYERVVSANRRT